MASQFSEMRQAFSGPVMMIGLAACMGGFLFGSDTGQVSGYIIMPDYLKRFAEDRGNGVHAWSTVREGLITGILSIGCLCGALAAGPLGDMLGRRKLILILCGVFYVGNTISITAMHAWYQIIIGRIISGIAVGGCSSLVPVYLSETVPRQVRGTIVASYQLFVTLGLLMSYIVNLGTSHVSNSGQWRGAIAIGYTWGILLLIGMLGLPESPRWLLAKDRQEQCLAALRFIAGKKNRDNQAMIDAEYQEIELRVRESNAIGKANLWSAFNPKHKTLYRTILGFMLQTFQQLTGANYFFYYGAAIFQSVGISNSFVTQIILGIVNVVCTFPGLYFIERFGRRKPLIFGGLWQMAWLLVFGGVGSQCDTSKKSIGSVMIFSACMFIASFASTWGPGTWVACGEMFPLRTRSVSASVATCGNWAWNFLLAFFTPFITKSIGYNYGFVFAGCNLAAVFCVYFFYYESAGLSLEQVDMMYNDPTVKPWTSSSWTPPDVEKRDDALEHSKEQDAVRSGVHASSMHHEKISSEKDSADVSV